MKCALPGMYGRVIPIKSDILLQTYVDSNFEKESIISDSRIDFDEAIKQYEKQLEDRIKDLDQKPYCSDSDKNKMFNYEKKIEALKRDLLKKDKEENNIINSQ